MKYIFDMYFIFSTSNHNPTRQTSSKHIVVSHSDSTSNHNARHKDTNRPLVVSHSDSTSNHNQPLVKSLIGRLFLIRILHQTTTLDYDTQV